MRRKRYLASRLLRRLSLLPSCVRGCPDDAEANGWRGFKPRHQVLWRRRRWLLRQPIWAQKGNRINKLAGAPLITHAKFQLVLRTKQGLPRLLLSSRLPPDILPPMASGKAPTDSAGDRGDRGANRLGGDNEGRFGLSPMPSERNVPLDDPDSYLPEQWPQANDVFGLVLILGSVQPIWHLRSLFSYRGIWQDDKRMTQQNVVLTIATGSKPSPSPQIAANGLL
jgi:hypothetical protein